jgi:hypothetical protein
MSGFPLSLSGLIIRQDERRNAEEDSSLIQTWCSGEQIAVVDGDTHEAILPVGADPTA